MEPIPEPFESRRLNDIRAKVSKDSPYEARYPERRPVPQFVADRTKAVAENASVSNVRTEVKYSAPDNLGINTTSEDVSGKTNYVAESHAAFGTVNNAGDLSSTDNVNNINPANTEPEIIEGEQQTLEQLNPSFMSKDARKKHKIIGQLFKTYWLIEYEDKLFIIDQHAAHEKVLFERTMAKIKDKEFTSQIISPPIVLSLDARETEMLEKYREQIERLGYEVEHFGGKEYMISAIPDNLYKIDMKDLFIEMLDDFSDMTGRETPDLILEKVASMSCKAAVKGNDELSSAEMDELIEELLTLDNPYNCPHGRPTIISMSKYEIEKKFKRIV